MGFRSKWIAVVPVVFRFQGFRFFFFSNEGNPREPIHIHARKGEKTAQFWVEPVVALAYAYQLSSRELKLLERLVHENRELVIRCWRRHFGE